MLDEPLDGKPGRIHRRSRVRLIAAAVALGSIALGVTLGVVIGFATRGSDSSSCSLNSTQSDAADATNQTNTTQSTQLPPEPGRPILLLAGDSLTEFAADPSIQGWVARLEHRFVTRADIANRGYAGYNSRRYRNDVMPGVINELKKSLKPSLITLWLGANDAAVVDGRSSSLHVPVDEFRENLVYMLSTFRQLSPGAKILLITQPTVDEDSRRDDQEKEGDPREPPDRNNQQAGLYAAASREAGKNVDGVTLLDMYDYLMTTYPNATQRASLFEDGLHFTPEGYGIVYNLVLAQIQTLLPNL